MDGGREGPKQRAIFLVRESLKEGNKNRGRGERREGREGCR